MGGAGKKPHWPVPQLVEFLQLRARSEVSRKLYASAAFGETEPVEVEDGEAVA